MDQMLWVTISEEEEQLMMEMWPDIVHNITKEIENSYSPNIAKWMEKVLQYTVPGGKKTRAYVLIIAYKLLAPNDQLTEENIRLVRILAWCLELLQASFVVIDDIQDRSLLRRGKPCWYRCNDIGPVAINDGVLLQTAMFYLIKKYFKEKDYYVNLLETFNDVEFKSIIGQSSDLFYANFGKKPNLDLFTMNEYNSIAKYKTSYYSFVMPIIVAMHMAGIKDQVMFREAKTISFKIGNLYQVQNDYLDLFGKFDVCGKDGTDIQEGKCTWFVVLALQRVTPEQRKILEECYGDSDPEKVHRVKQLFTDLGLLNTYSTYEEETYNLLKEHIKQMSCGLPHSLFLTILWKLYHRMS